MSQNPSWLDAVALRREFAAGRLSPVEVVETVLARAERVQRCSGPFVTLTGERALAQARRAERDYRRGGGGDRPLLGVPVTLKDLTPTRGVHTTLGSTRWRDWVPDADAPVAERLAAAGAILLGKTNTSELGWKADTGGPLLPTTRNPHDLTRTAGGSSGGAAAAVAAGLGPLAQGGDAAGSIRVPAAFCGVVGFKPSTGAIPIVPATRFGELGAIGPLARSVRDIGLFMRVTAGADPRDHRSAAPAAGWNGAGSLPETSPARLRLGWLHHLNATVAVPEVEERLRPALVALTELGHAVEEVESLAGDLAEVIDAIWCGVFATLVQDGAGHDPGLVALAQRGRLLSRSAMAEAEQHRDRFRQRVTSLMGQYDVLVSATTVGTAPPLAAAEPAPPSSLDPRRPAAYLESARFAYPFNLTGQPAVTVPVGAGPGRLPVGLQLIGRRGEDRLVLRVAAQLEAAGVVANAGPEACG